MSRQNLIRWYSKIFLSIANTLEKECWNVITKKTIENLLTILTSRVSAFDLFNYSWINFERTKNIWDNIASIILEGSLGGVNDYYSSVDDVSIVALREQIAALSLLSITSGSIRMSRPSIFLLMQIMMKHHMIHRTGQK
jgi:hypothetical protein